MIEYKIFSIPYSILKYKVESLMTFRNFSIFDMAFFSKQLTEIKSNSEGKTFD